MRSASKIPAGDVVIEVKSRLQEAWPISPLDVVVSVDGKENMSGTVPRTAPLLFTANECLDIGMGWGSPVSTEYFEMAPFEFEGDIGVTTISYPE